MNLLWITISLVSVSLSQVWPLPFSTVEMLSLPLHQGKHHIKRHK